MSASSPYRIRGERPLEVDRFVMREPAPPPPAPESDEDVETVSCAYVAPAPPGPFVARHRLMVGMLIYERMPLVRKEDNPW